LVLQGDDLLARGIDEAIVACAPDQGPRPPGRARSHRYRGASSNNGCGPCPLFRTTASPDAMAWTPTGSYCAYQAGVWAAKSRLSKAIVGRWVGEIWLPIKLHRIGGLAGVLVLKERSK